MTQRDLFDGSPDGPSQRHSPTSRAAAAAMASDTSRLRGLVLREILTAGGLTDEEGIDATGLSPSTYRPRRVELVERGQVRDAGRTRPTRSGRKAVIWEATA